MFEKQNQINKSVVPMGFTKKSWFFKNKKAIVV